MKPKFFLWNPFYVFILSFIALIGAITVYINWSFQINETIELVTKTFPLGEEKLSDPNTWPIITLVALCFGFIIYAVILLFTLYKRTQNIYNLQSNFVNNFTHELKTPIASLQLWLQTLQKRELTEKQREDFYSRMQLDINRLSHNVEQILITSKVEGQGKKIEKTPLRITAMIYSFLAKYQVPGVKINFNLKVDDDVLIIANESLLETVFNNIMTNAINYCDKDPIIDIIAYTESNKLYIEIKDNGLGISKENLKKIFNKFYTLISSRSKKNKGSGLGLYLAKMILSLHNGKIKAHSDGKDLGAVFKITLPTVKADKLIIPTGVSNV